MKNNYRYFIILILCLLFTGVQAKTILYVASADPAIPEDQAIIDSIKTLGYDVIPVEQTIFSTDFTSASAYSSYDAILISETIGSANLIAFATAGYPIPCVVLEGYAPKANRWAWWADDATYYFDYIGGAAHDPDALTMTITDNSHYITKTYTAGQEVTWSTSTTLAGAESVGFKIGEVIPNAIQLATSKSVNLDGFPVLWAIPEGSAPLTERMVLYPTHKNLMTVGELGATGEMYRIINRSLQWVLKDEKSTTRANTLKSNANDVKLLGNSASGKAKFQFNLQKAGKVSVSVVKLNGQKTLQSSDSYFQAGSNQLDINTSSFAPGVYLYVFKANNATSVGKMIIAQ